MALNKIDIGNEMSRGWALFQPNMGLLIGTGLLVILLSGLTCGILAGPLVVGFFLMIRRLQQNDPATVQVGDVFKGLESFAQSLILVVCCGVPTAVLCRIVPVIGCLVALAANAVLMWGMMLIAYQRLGAIDALKRIFSLLQKGDFTTPLLFAVLAGIVSGLGFVACLIGVFFTIPLGFCMLACAHETLFGSGAVIGATATESQPADATR